MPCSPAYPQECGSCLRGYSGCAVHGLKCRWIHFSYFCIGIEPMGETTNRRKDNRSQSDEVKTPMTVVRPLGQPPIHVLVKLNCSQMLSQ